MKTVLRLAIVTFTIILSIIAKPQPHGFDDEGEISVPRSPKIQGPSTVNLLYSNGTSMENLKCDIEGTPTPTVIWLKDEKEIQSDSDSYNTTYNMTDLKAELVFTPIAYKNEQDLIGNFSCIAANFLGKAQKDFKISMAEPEPQDSSNTTTTNIEISTSITTTTTSQISNSSSSTEVVDSATYTPTTDSSRLLKILGI